MRLLTVFCIALGLSTAASASTYYVSGVGSDAASGLTAKTAFRTLQHAADLTEPGDVVYAMDGIYSIPEGNSAGAVLAISRSGTADEWITYKAMQGQTPTIRTRQWNGVSFGPQVSYVELNGFTVTGNNDNVDRDAAIRRANTAKPVPDPAYDGNCVAVDGRKGTATRKPHHIRILNNTLSKCGGGGVAAIEADYITISGNTIYGCSWYSIYGTSGISTLESWNSDDSTGYKMIITRNKLYENKELVWWVAYGKITDGEAIIIDTLRSPNIGNYNGRTLVADNLIFNNGSSAVEVFRSDHVDVLNNSTYANVTVPEETGRGELGINEAKDIRVLNNIFVSAKGQNPLVVEMHELCSCVIGSNIYFGGDLKPADRMGPGAIFADPKYRNVDVSHPSLVDLKLGPGSPALHSGEPAIGSSVDFTGKARPLDSSWDRGAYQF